MIEYRSSSIQLSDFLVYLRRVTKRVKGIAVFGHSRD